MPIKAWGYELLLDCADCAPDKIRSANNVDSFARDLVQRINMVPYGDPSIIHFGDGDKEGFTLIQLIQTSNISGHFSNDTNAAYINVFSCKTFDPVEVIKCVYDYFQPLKVSDTFVVRGV